MVDFVRQLGAEPGVQLNPTRDESEIPASGTSDQVFAIPMRLTRGRIDKPYLVDRGNTRRKIGKGEPIRKNALNEALVQAVEALNKGAYQAVVQRLVTPNAKIKYAVVKPAASGGGFDFSVADTVPASGFVMAVKHLECFNDGIVVELHADENIVGGITQANDTVTLRIRDIDGNALFEFSGSLNADAVDDYGQSRYLPDIVSKRTQLLEVVTGDVLSVASGSPAYGYDVTGKEKWVKSGTLVCFEEGGNAYTVTDYRDACAKLAATNLEYGYIASGGTQSPGLLAELASLAYEVNKPLRYDVHGSLTPEAAIAFVEQLNLGANPTSQLIQPIWSPNKSDDPTGINPRGYFGKSAMNIAYACLRNASKNSKGFAPKNYPIAGRMFPVQRTGIEPTYTPSTRELSLLAKAKITPVLYEVYSGGGLYVFRDILTSRPTDNSLMKLTSVAEMAQDLEGRMTRFDNDIKFLPMQIAVKRKQDFLAEMLADAQTSGWLVPSNDTRLGGAAYMFSVKPREDRPYDVMDTQVWASFDGAVRQLFNTLTITR